MHALKLSKLISICIVILSLCIPFQPIPQPVYAQITSPGGVSTDLQLWLKADSGAGVTTDAATITTWLNIAGTVHATTPTGTPTFESDPASLLNFNPVVRFDGNSFFTYASSLGIGATEATAFSAIKINTIANHAILGPVAPGALNAFELLLNNSGIAQFRRYNEPGDLVTANTTVANGAPTIYLATRNGTGNASINLNGIVAGSTTNSDPFADAPGFLIGASFANGALNGDLPELIVYSRGLTAGEVNRVESYLALKYGVTLGDAIRPIDYTASDSTILWTRDAAYQHDIAGIGRDDMSTLNQKQAKSVNSDDLVSIGLGTIAASNANNPNNFTEDRAFLLWGNDNGSTDVTTAIPDVARSFRMGRIWKTQETGLGGNPVGAVLVQIPTNSLPLSQGEVGYLIRSDDALFDSSDAFIPMLVNGSAYEASVDFLSGQFFTFARTNDTDVDGIGDIADLDDDNDGILNIAEGNGQIDSDGDGIPDSSDLDSDQDGIPDNIEAQSTAGYILPSDTDSDGDGLDDAYEPAGLTSVNTDGADNPDYLDSDSDNADGSDTQETGRVPGDFNDADSDGLDDDIDNDDFLFGPPNAGITSPATSYPNSNGSGDLDYRQAAIPPTITSDGGGATATLVVAENSTAVTTVAATGDPTITFSISGGADSTRFTLNTMSGGLTFNLAPDFESPADSEGDNRYTVIVRAVNSSGFAEQTITVLITDISESNFDEDQLPDNTDSDDDNDGIPDLVEGDGAIDTDNDRSPDSRDPDSDSDSVHDSLECPVQPCRDTDSDSLPDFQDTDDDNDSIDTISEDSDGDGDLADDDADGDNIPDYLDPDPISDFDNDGLPDTIDPDDDNDGTLDPNEGDGTVDTDGDGAPDSRDLDSDDDGIPDPVEGDGDPDSDDQPSYRDLDSDNDSVFDRYECPNPAPCRDNDTDAAANFLDDDDDNDDLPTRREQPDPNGDGNPADAVDTDRDGLPDYLDRDRGNPTAISLIRFMARWQGDAVELTWETAVEIDNIGFHLSRSATGQRADATSLTAQRIASQGVGGGLYRFVDESVAAGTVYTYWLEEIASDGTHNMLGVATTSMADSQVFLPVITR